MERAKPVHATREKRELSVLDFVPQITRIAQAFGIERIEIDTGKRIICFPFASDFSLIVEHLQIDARQLDGRSTYGLPYAVDQIAFGKYEGWTLTGHILRERPDETNLTTKEKEEKYKKRETDGKLTLLEPNQSD